MLLVIIFLTVAIPTLYSIYNQNFTTRATKLNKIPGGRIYPVVGNAFELLQTPDGVIDRLTEYFHKFGPCVRFWRFNAPYVFIAEHQTAHQILSCPTHIDKGLDYDLLRKKFGDGLPFSNAAKWKQDRKILNAGLKSGMFTGFLHVFNKHGKRLKTDLALFDGKVASNFHPILSECTLGIVYESLLGRKNVSDTGKISSDSEIAQSIRKSADGVKTTLLKPWMVRFSKRKRDEKNSFNGKVTREVLQYISDKNVTLASNLDSDQDEGKCLMDILLDPQIPRSIQDIADHIKNFLAAGSDTTSNSLNFTLFLLAANPHHQDLVAEELLKIFGKEGITNPITFEQVREMHYLEMCIKESLRIFPPVPVFTRRIKEDVKLNWCDLTIPKDVDVCISVIHLHRDKEIFPKPEIFDPLRFTPENIATRPHSAFIPFSAGIRNCIGQKYAMIEMKVLLALIISDYVFSTKVSQDEVRLTYGFITGPTKPLHMTITPRSTI